MRFVEEKKLNVMLWDIANHKIQAIWVNRRWSVKTVTIIMSHMNRKADIRLELGVKQLTCGC